MVDMNRLTAFTAAVPSPGTRSGSDATSHTDAPTVFACETIRAWVVWPIPRRGVATTRWNATTSCGLTSSVMYASASLTSARS
jgi:hypothetical protein